MKNNRLLITAGNPSPSDAPVIQMTAPFRTGGTQGEIAQPADCCRSCLELAAERGMERVDIFSLPADGRGYPPVQAATVAVRAIMEFLDTHPLPRQVRIVCPTESDAAVYRQTWNLWYASDKEDRM